MRGIVVAVVLGALVAAGCSGDDDDSAAPDSALAAAFERVPASLVDDGAPVTFFDFAASGVERVDPAADTDELSNYLVALSDAGMPRLGVLQGRENVSQLEDVYGFSLATVDVTIDAGFDEEGLLLVGGEFDEAAIDDALESHEAEPERSERGEATLWLWPGEDGALLRDTADGTDPLGEILGRPHRIAVFDDYIASTLSTDLLFTVVDGAPPLSEHETIGPLIDALVSEGAYTGTIAPEPGTTLDVFGPQPREEYEEEIDGMMLAEFAVLGIGMSAPDEMVVVYSHEDDDDAAANEERLETILTEGSDVVTGVKWSETFNSFDVERDGPVVIARLEPQNPLQWIEMVSRRSPLFAYDEEL